MSYGGTRREKEGIENGSDRPALPRRLSKPKQTRRKSTYTVTPDEVGALAGQANDPLSPLDTAVPLIPRPSGRPNIARSRSVSLDSSFKALGVVPNLLLHSASEGGCTESPPEELPRPLSPTVILKALEATEAQSQATLQGGGLRRKESLAFLENDARRRCRQTLVEIQDDGVFHEVLQTLKKTEGRRQMSNVSPIQRPISVATEVAWEKSVRAWFVTRELVKSERSYGRYLARGIQVSVHEGMVVDKIRCYEWTRPLRINVLHLFVHHESRCLETLHRAAPARQKPSLAELRLIQSGVLLSTYTPSPPGSLPLVMPVPAVPQQSNICHDF